MNYKYVAIALTGFMILIVTHMIAHEIGAGNIRKNIVVNKYDNRTMYKFYGKCYNENGNSYCANLYALPHLKD